MSGSEHLPEEERPAEKRRSARERTRAATLVVIVVLMTLFAAKNTAKIKVDWIVGSGRAPVIVVIVVSLLVGIVFSYFADRLARRRR